MTGKPQQGGAAARRARWHSKPFLYLVQSPGPMPYPQLRRDRAEVLLLTWRQPNPRWPSIHYPGSSWNEGRNTLLAAALQREARTGLRHRYFIFLDDDCRLEQDRGLARQVRKRLAAEPFGTFERFLRAWQPAVGYARYDWQHYEPGCETNLGYNFDALLNAFHREAIDTLLPYYTGFDAESWLYSQLLVCHLAALVFHPHRLQCNLIQLANRHRHGYANRRRHWHIPTTFLAGAMDAELRPGMNLTAPNSPTPPPGLPARKAGHYAARASWLEQHSYREHPFFRDRRLPPVEPPASRQAREGRIAVLFCGSCRGLQLTCDAWRRNLLDRLGSFDLFMYVPEDCYSTLAPMLQPTVLSVEPDRPLPEGRLVNGVNCRFKRGVQAYLQQLYGLRGVDRLRQAHERAAGIRYTGIIRCRPDLLLLEPVTDVRRLDLNYLYVPDFHGFDGINDRFAIGSPEHMSIYCNKLAELEPYAMQWLAASPAALAVSAEMFTAGQLRQHAVPVRTLAVRFNRVRHDRIKHDVERKRG